MVNANSFDAKTHACTGLLGDFADPVVQLHAGHRAAGRRERRAGPVDFDLAAESAHPQAPVPDAGIQPVAQPQPFQLGDRTRRQPVAAGLVAGKVAESMTRTSMPARAAQAAAADPAGPAPTTTTSALGSMLTSMLVE